MADDNYPRDPADDVDAADVAFVEPLLAALAFLSPDEAPHTAGPAADAPVEPMPDWVWDRLSSALADETARAATPPASGRSRLARWGGGLVAASVAVLAVGVGVTAFQGDGSGEAVVAGNAAPAVASTGAVAESRELAAGDASLDPAILQAPQALSAAGFVPPVKMLMRSDTDYTPDQLQTQVVEVLKEVGVDSAQAAEDLAGTVPDEQAPDTGFTSSAERLRDCITSLTDSESSTALVVDRSTFEGQDAGVVVAPEYEAASSTPASPASRPDMSELMVWVVDPDCNVTMQLWIRLRP